MFYLQSLKQSLTFYENWCILIFASGTGSRASQIFLIREESPGSAEQDNG